MAISTQSRQAAVILLGVICTLCTGCAGNSKNDPFEKTNRAMYNFNDGVDRYALKPLADGYTKIIPRPIRNGVGNGFDNLVYFNVIANDFLQGKGNQGLSDTGRMAVNSTVGIAGFFDVATPWKMPAHDNDLGITLRKWGVGPGPYVVLPLLGPSSTTDVTGVGVKYVATPTTWLGLPWGITIPLYVVDTVDTRSRYDSVVKFRNETAIDPYIFTREAYLQYREARARDGKAAVPTTQNSIYDEEADAPTPAPATQPAAAPTK
jgi:phospholipid-binding lipoprotein MlaA